MGKKGAVQMKTELKTVTVIPYGRLVGRVRALVPAEVEHTLRVTRAWKRFKRPDDLWELLITFSDELDEEFVETFRKRATPDTRLLVLNDCRFSDHLLSRVIDLQIRSPQRFYVVDLPFKQSDEKNWEKLLHSLFSRLRAALESKEEAGRIFDAQIEGGILRVVSPDYQRLEIPISKIDQLAKADQQTVKHFEVDDDGSYIYWPDLHLHLGWEQLLQIVHPDAVQKAKQKSRQFNERYGSAIRRVREEAGLDIAAIPGLSSKQLRRIERGECRLTSNAAKELAKAHGFSRNEYLRRLAAALGD
jgi:ribosome-binding protein aMBF1 (putative translation factor)